MQDKAITALHCEPANGPAWQTFGMTREVAEAYYIAAILQGAAERPAYRIVIQYKVDQHPPWMILSTALH